MDSVSAHYFLSQTEQKAKNFHARGRHASCLAKLSASDWTSVTVTGNTSSQCLTAVFFVFGLTEKAAAKVMQDKKLTGLTEAMAAREEILKEKKSPLTSKVSTLLCCKLVRVFEVKFSLHFLFHLLLFNNRLFTSGSSSFSSNANLILTFSVASVLSLCCCAAHTFEMAETVIFS